MNEILHGISFSLSLSNYPIKQATRKVTIRVEIFRFMVPLFQSYCIRSGKLYTLLWNNDRVSTRYFNYSTGFQDDDIGNNLNFRLIST